MRTERGQRVAAAWAVRGQPYPAVGAELPVAFDLTAAITALLHELVKLLLELQEGGLPPALLRLLLVLLFVHGVPSVSHWTSADSSLRSRVISQGINLPPDRERVLCSTSCARQLCASVHKVHGHRECPAQLHMHPLSKCTPQKPQG
jgi:hypothetical protein